MIPVEKVKLIINTYETLEKELASGEINNPPRTDCSASREWG